MRPSNRRLTRRDAIAALTVTGIVIGGRVASRQLNSDDGRSGQMDGFSDDELSVLTAVATAVYPTSLDGIREFVETYTIGRIEDNQEYRIGVTEAITSLNEYAEDWYDEQFESLSSDFQARLLKEIGVPTSSPDPNGIDSERIRYYLVNELLYALYTTPRGGELVGIENPQGHPGGVRTYQRGPQP